MTTKARKYCASFPCRSMAEAGSAYCGEHRPPRAPKETDPFYLSVRWRRFRAWYLSKHPLCQQCEKEGRLTPARMVDHIVALKDGGAPTSEANSFSICFKCHSIKTANYRAENMKKNHHLGYENNRCGNAGETS